MSDKLVQVSQPIALSKSASPDEMMKVAKQLSPREQQQVAMTFASGHYEMASTFLWTRAMAGLKKQLGTLGVQFLGELLERPDIKPHEPIVNVITDHEALRLAEQLQMFGPTEAMRLRHAMELVSHFSEAPDEADAFREMTQDEAAGILRSCVQSILAHERFDGASEFADFRKRLEEESFKEDSALVLELLRASSFFKRTTLRVLLSAVKTESGASLQHAQANLELLLGLMWSELSKPDKWMVGKTYAELHNAGNRPVAAALGRCLAERKGFDFVPENLRSNGFITMAKRVIDAHNGYDNFYNEPEPMKVLASLGSTIPQPALYQCMTATLCVRIGNFYDRSRNAQEDAKAVLDRLRPDEWSYYLDECLPSDDDILGKLQGTGRTIQYWKELVIEYKLNALEVQNDDVRALLRVSFTGGGESIRTAARVIHTNAHRAASAA